MGLAGHVRENQERAGARGRRTAPKKGVCQQHRGMPRKHAGRVAPFRLLFFLLLLRRRRPLRACAVFFSRAFVSSPILILRELDGVSGTRVENESTVPVRRGRGNEPGGRKLTRSFAPFLYDKVCVKKKGLRYVYFSVTFSFAKKYYISFI